MTKPANLRWGIASLLFLATGLSFFDRQVLSTLAPVITRDLGIDNVTYSHVVSAFILSYTVMFTLSGRLLDGLGLKVGMALSVGLWTLSSFLHGLTQSALQLGIFRFLLGVGEGGCFPGATKGALEWFPPEERALAVGFANGGSAFGAVLAPPVTVWISLRFGWRGAFLATGIMGALWLAAWAGFFRVKGGRKAPTTPNPSLTKEGNQTTPRPSLTKEGNQTTPRPSLTKEGNQTTPRPSLSKEGNQTTPNPSLSKEGNLEGVIPWRTLLARREVWGLMGARFLLDPVFYFYMFWIPQYLSQARHIPLSTIGNLTWIPFLTLGLANIAGGWISDHLVRSGWTINAARKTMLGLAAALTPVSMLCVAVSGAGLAIALMSVLMFAHGFWIANYMTAIGDLFPTRAVGSVAGISGSAGGVGGILSSFVVGALAQSGFYTPLFVACGVLYPVAFVVILLTVPNIRAIGAELGSGAAQVR